MDGNAAGLAANPFERDAQLDDACLPNTFAALCSELQSGLRSPRGLSILVAASGSGKSVMAAAFARRLEAVVQTALIVRPTSSVSAIARDALAQLDAEGSDFTLDDDWVGALHANVVRRGHAGRQTAILIDDAHRLSPQTLEDLAGLFDGDPPPRLHVFLFGRQRLLDRMQAGAEPALQAHLLKICRLEPLGVRESVRYLERRLAMGGLELTALFTDEAIDEVVQKAAGRLIALEEVAARALHRASKRGAERAVAGDVITIAPRAILEEEEGMASQQQPLRFQLTDDDEDLSGEVDQWIADDEEEEAVEWGEEDDDEEWQADEDEDDAVVDEPALSWDTSLHRLEEDREDEEIFAPAGSRGRSAGGRRNVGRALLSVVACLVLVLAANQLPGPAGDVPRGRDSMLFPEPLSSKPEQIMRLATTVEAADADAQVAAWQAQPPRPAAASRHRSAAADSAARPDAAARARAGAAGTEKPVAQPDAVADAMGPQPRATNAGENQRHAGEHERHAGEHEREEPLAGQQIAKTDRETAPSGAAPAASKSASGSKGVSAKNPAVSSARAASASVYTVQLGAFKTRSNAEELVTRLRGKSTRILREGGLYRVMSGSFASKRDATVHEATLRRAGYTTFVRTAVF